MIKKNFLYIQIIFINKIYLRVASWNFSVNSQDRKTKCNTILYRCTEALVSASAKASAQVYRSFGFGKLFLEILIYAVMHYIYNTDIL